MRYNVLGLQVESEVSLSLLKPCPLGGKAGDPSVVLRQMPQIGWIDQAEWQLVRRVLADPRGKYWSLYQADNGYLLEYDGLVQFRISPDGSAVGYFLSRDDLDDFFQWAFLHLVLLFVLHLKAVPVYHGGAVAVDSGALLFFGHSGQGKSTLTASFGSAGYPVITDDVLVVQEKADNFYALPGFPWVRLCRESVDAVFGRSALESLPADGDGKLRVDPGTGLLPFNARPSPVKSVYVLSEGKTLPGNRIVEIAPISRAEAVGILLSRDSMLPVLQRGQLAQVLESLTRLVKGVPVWQLNINRDLDRLQEVVAAVMEHEQSRCVVSGVPLRGREA